MDRIAGLRSQLFLLSIVLTLIYLEFRGQLSAHSGICYRNPSNSSLEISGDITLEGWLRPDAPLSSFGHVLLKCGVGDAFDKVHNKTVAFWQSGTQNSGPASSEFGFGTCGWMFEPLSDLEAVATNYMHFFVISRTILSGYTRGNDVPLTLNKLYQPLTNN